MIRFAPTSRIPVRLAAVGAVGIVGSLALAGCTTTSTAEGNGSASGSSSDADSGATYADGTYTADGAYQTPESVETITVTLTLAGGVVTDVEVTGDPQRPESRQYQGQFVGGISAEVVGKSLDEISVSRVAGSSLTSRGFTQALETIKSEAAS